ncbi:hypothetical protein [Bacteroides sp. An269]|uniref:hypothetical protein n=1 Tax=Bacteroides sp. An269 TaxID=1965613 RepID=UPI000B38EEA4|nr:hypothetical protein [Bacteroides sp. An269]OUO84436.1 hypothetical protein B5F71_01815 [Bacteroides sp. An269]
MKKTGIFLLLLSLLAACQESDNVEALARGESDGDCSDCAIYAPGICKDWGWGGCTGKNAIKYL